MLEFKNKFVTYLVNFILAIWQCTQWIPGLIGLAIFHNYTIYRNESAGVTVIKVNKGYFIGGACFSCGPIIFVTPNCNENVVKHETGHSVQSLIFGPLFHLIISIPSVILFWIRKFKHKDALWYHSKWPEVNADYFGDVDVSKL